MCCAYSKNSIRPLNKTQIGPNKHSGLKGISVQSGIYIRISRVGTQAVFVI